MPKPEPPDDFRPEESPLAWFADLLRALDHGDFTRAAECQHELTRLGWRVDRRKLRKATDGKGVAS